MLKARVSADRIQQEADEERTVSARKVVRSAKRALS